MSDKVCAYCGYHEDDHDYEHLARYCYPVQIELLRANLEAAEQLCKIYFDIAAKELGDDKTRGIRDNMLAARQTEKE